MDFSYAADQQMLRDSAERYLQERYSYAQRAKIWRGGGYSAEVWRDFAKFGWLGAGLSEDAAGYGGGAEEVAILAECMGRHVVLEPYIWTAVVGATLVRQGFVGERRMTLLKQLVSGDLHVSLAAFENDVGQGFSHISTKARPSSAGWSLTGRKAVVPNGGVADLFLVTAVSPEGLSLFAVRRDTPGLTTRVYRSNDGQTLAELALNGVGVGAEDRLSVPGAATLDLLELAFDHGSAAVCAEVVGSCAWLVETTCTYLKTREQYGAPLAKFQVLQHKLADMYVAVELARSMAHVAAAALSKTPADRMREVSAARLQSIRCARLVGRDAVQMHGGMGMSQELDVSAHFQRLTMSTLQFGDEASHLSRMAYLSD